MLEQTTENTKAVAVAAGFANYQAMHRAFVAVLRISPAEYRRRFGTPDPASAGLIMAVQKTAIGTVGPAWCRESHALRETSEVTAVPVSTVPRWSLRSVDRTSAAKAA